MNSFFPHFIGNTFSFYFQSAAINFSFHSRSSRKKKVCRCSFTLIFSPFSAKKKENVQHLRKIDSLLDFKHEIVQAKRT